ncbi:DUF4333 domain-containing protein [Rhodococcus qingshengii]|uniref:DUF4333 domain-containing protein n=1 Tax=Rhodococcus qingshengii TaxID=334542 RepID=UPI0021B141FF|nr:DUF4333 domain-containing protein [Rhodococcus qingshengii]MCT6736590.1 DUF4333 domain-containing protein [Rhodococcus qingshengii]
MSTEPPRPPSSHQPLLWALGAVSLVAVAAIVLAAFLVGRQSAAPRASTGISQDSNPQPVTTTTGPPDAVRYLDGIAVAKGVSKIVTESYGAKNLTDTHCPDSEPIQIMNTFTCTVRIAGEASEVTVTVTDSDGTFEVSRPR